MQDWSGIGAQYVLMENPAAARAIKLFMLEGKAKPIKVIGLPDQFFKIKDRILTPD